MGAASNLSLGVLYMNEMLPAGQLQVNGFSISLGIMLGVFLMELMGTYYINSIDFTFLYVSLWPPFIMGTSFLLWMYAYENEPLDYCVENLHLNECREQAGNNINTLYNIKVKDEGKDRTVIDAIKESRRPTKTYVSQSETDHPIALRKKEADKKKLSMDDEDHIIVTSPALIEVLHAPRFRGATYAALLLGCAYGASGYMPAMFYIIQHYRASQDDTGKNGDATCMWIASGVQAAAILFTPFLASVTSVKKILFAGVAANVIGMVIMAASESSRLAGAITFLFTFQIGIGTFFFIYIVETAQTAAQTWAYTLALGLIMTQQLIQFPQIDWDKDAQVLFGNPSALTSSACCAVFAVLNAIYAAGIWFYVKDSKGCDKREQRLLYWNQVDDISRSSSSNDGADGRMNKSTLPNSTQNSVLGDTHARYGDSVDAQSQG